MRIPHAELLGIAKQNKPRTITLTQRPRMAAGRAYTVTSVEKVQDGVVRHKRRVTCLAVERVQVQDGERVTDVDAWRVTLVKDDVVDHVKLLKARPGRSDYTDRPALALPDEPEAVDAVTLARFAKAAEEAGRLGSQYRVDHETRKQRDELARAVDELSARKDIGEAAAKRLGRIKRELARLERELRAA